MNLKSSLMILGLCALAMATSLAQTANPLYKDKNAPVENRVSDLLKRMTLDEKILQLNQWTAGENNNVNNVEDKVKKVTPGIGSLIYFSTDPVLRNAIQKKAMEESRLSIPIIFGFDVIHGYRTVYPISLAQGCSWNPELVTRCAAIAAKEARLSGIDWTFSPMIDVARDARWGRISEGYGEDPYTNAVFGVATVKGYQGNKLSDETSVAACLKHFVGYGESEGGRDYHYTDISQQALWETYLIPYEACVKAGAATLMSAFNDISGVPASANHYTMTEVLRNRWKHDGFIVSDWGAVEQLMPQGVAADKKEACMKAFNAGVDMDMVDNAYFDHMKALIAEKKISMDRVDDAVARILRIKFRLGLFDRPYAKELNEDQRYLQKSDLKVAEELASETMVLLKNNNQLLPIKPTVKSIAFVGPMIEEQKPLLGSWLGQGLEKDVITLKSAFDKELGASHSLSYSRGCNFDGDDRSGFDAALTTASAADLVVVCLGEKMEWSGENASRSTIALPAIQEELLAAVKKTGKPLIVLLSSGRPLELQRIEPMADAMLEMWQPGVTGGNAVAGILSGRYNPSGKLCVTFPLTTGQIPVYYNMHQAARPYSGQYQDISTEPMYWFGHGLSYSKFEYGTIKLSSNSVKAGGELLAEIEVKNSSSVDGKEAVQWFVSDPVASVTRPMKELKFFEKKMIKAGETVTYRFEIDPMRDLSFYNADGKRLLEEGEFVLSVGKQTVKFNLVK